MARDEPEQKEWIMSLFRFALLGFGLTVAACALPASGSAETPLSERAPLNFSETISTDGTGENTAFARSVAKRFGAGLSRETILADIKAQGFSCDEAETSCTRSAMDGACADAWIVDLEDAGVSGRHVKRCMGALADEEQ